MFVENEAYLPKTEPVNVSNEAHLELANRMEALRQTIFDELHKHSRLYYPADARETNYPGRASKGYGGYGGNGGLRQYYGYWQPDYQGQRNRGYGYNTNTDYYGLPRSQQAARGQYINALRNYRGYD
uniref:Uncharacterized protein n=1 Tax=Glossina austeni TaxID=7395 RepID=A0A1A9VF92_GLOAU